MSGDKVIRPQSCLRFFLISTVSSLLCFSQFSFGQNKILDSLETKAGSLEASTKKVDLLNELAWNYRPIKVEKAEKFAMEAIKLAEEIDYTKGWSSGYNTYGLIVSESGKAKEALALFDKAIAGKEKIGDKKGVATITNNKGISFAKLKEFDKAEICYQTALKARIELGDKKGIGDTYNTLGILARDRGEYDKSITFFKQSLSVREEIKDIGGIAFSLINMAANYGDEGDYLKSVELIQRAIPLLEQVKDRGSLVVAYNNLGVENKNLKNFPDAIKYNLESIRLGKETGHVHYITNAWKSLGDCYLEIKNYSKGREAYTEALILAEQLKNTADIAHCHSGLARIFEKENDFKSAAYHYHIGTKMAEESGILRDQLRLSIQEAQFLVKQGNTNEAQQLVDKYLPIAQKEGLKLNTAEFFRIKANLYLAQRKNADSSLGYYRKYAALKDSIYSDQLPKQFAEQQTRFETARKEAELRLLRQQEEIDRLKMVEQSLQIQQRNMALALAVLALFGLSLASYFYRRKQKSETREKERIASQKAEEAERVRLAKDIHDEFGSGLTKIRFVTEMAIQKASAQPEITQLLDPISKTAVQLVDNMRDLIWVLHPANNSLDVLTSRIREYANEYLKDFGWLPTFSIPDTIPEIEIQKEVHRNILMVVKEAIQNIAKHSEAKHVHLVFDFRSGFQLSIEDDGKGHLSDPTPGKGNGLLNMKNRMHQIGGNLDIKTGQGQGTTVVLFMPLSFRPPKNPT